MPNDNVRLAIHAAALLTFLIAVVVLVALGKLAGPDGLTWILTGAPVSSQPGYPPPS